MLRTYAGACHCGRVKFEVDAAIDRVSACNCSICRMRGALNVRVPAKHIRFLTSLDDLSVYRWGTLTASDYFCPTCGISPFRRPRMLSDEERAQGGDVWAVNARCLAGVDLEKLLVERARGAELPLD
jgi:hypothetical protein